MIVSRRPANASLLALRARAAREGLAPSGAAAPIEEVSLPMALPAGARLYAVDAQGAMREVTDALNARRDRVRCERGATLEAAGVDGIALWRMSTAAVRPSGGWNGRVTINVVGLDRARGARFFLGGEDVTTGALADGTPAGWENGAESSGSCTWSGDAWRFGVDEEALNANEGRIGVQVPGDALRTYRIAPVAPSEWCRTLDVQTDPSTTAPTINLGFVPGAEATADAFLPRGPEAITLALRGWQTGYAASLPDGTDVTNAAPPGRDNPWLSGGATLGGVQAGTWNIGVPRAARAIIMRYGPRTTQAFAVPVADANGVATVDVTTPAFVALRLRGLPPYSRLFDGTTEVSAQAPVGGAGGWDGRDWIIGLRSAATQITVAYPSGRRVTLPVPPALVRGERVVAVPADPGAAQTIPSMVALRLRGLPRGADGQPLAAVLFGDATSTFNSRPGGTPAGWDGNDWVIGMFSSTRAATVRYEAGGTRELTWPAIVAGQTEVAVDAAPPTGSSAPSRTTLRLTNLPAESRVFVGAMDVTTDGATDGSSSGWLDRVGGTYALGVPVGTTAVRVVYPASVGAAPRTITLPSPERGIVTVDAAPPGVSSSMVDLRLVNVASDATVLVGEQDATTWRRANGAPATYDAATRTRTIGLPLTVRAFRVREARGTVRTIDALPPAVDGVVTVTLSAPSTPSTARRNVRLTNFVPGARVFVDGLDVTTAAPTGDRPGGFVNATDWELSVPASARSVTVRYPSRGERTLALGTSGSDGFTVVAVPVDPALGAGGSGGEGLAPGARRINIAFANLPDGARVMYGGVNIVNAPKADGSPATRGAPIGPIDGGGSAPIGETVFGFDFDPAIAQEIAVLPPVGSTAWSQILYPIRPQDVRGDLLRLAWNWSRASTSPDPLAGTRVWLVNPPEGAYAVARISRTGSRTEGTRVDEVRLTGPTTQLSRAAAFGESPSTSDTDVMQGARLPPAPVWVTEARLSLSMARGMGDDGLVGVDVVLPNGTRLPVSLSPVPTDGIFRVDLSAYPGPRPTHSSTGDAEPAQASAGGGGGVALAALAALAAGGWWFTRKASHAARPNPAPHRPRRAR